jgi:Domain of unknown function (DUF4124)
MTFAHLPAVSRNPFLAFMLAGCLLLLQSPAFADVYKWVNENNEVQYTQMPPPPGIKYVRIQTAEHPNMIDAEGADQTTDDQAAPTDEAQPETRAGSKSMSEYEAEVARVSRENCKIANNNLVQLNMGGHLRYRNEKGEYVNMSEEERQKRIAEANRQIKQFCEKESK